MTAVNELIQGLDTRLRIGSDRAEGIDQIEVIDPATEQTLTTVYAAGTGEALQSVDAAAQAAPGWAATPPRQRSDILRKAYDLMLEREEQLAELIILENGKTYPDAIGEIRYGAEFFRWFSEEAVRIIGEIRTAPRGDKRIVVLPEPVGISLMVTPWNFPSAMATRKIAPALAAGCTTILKPASDTPLSALKLVEIFLEAGTPPEALQCLTGSGGVIGDALCADPRVRKITFTGSRDIGEHICRTAGLKRVTMELGSNAPLIVMPDADPERVAQAAAASGYSNAGQVCISTQRVVTHEKIYGDFLDAFKATVEDITTGNPLVESTKMGPMIREEDAVRVDQWVEEAVSGGAELVLGGQRNGQMYQPTIVSNVSPEMKISCDEVFGPVVGVTRVSDIDEAIALANDTNYGLSAAIFTQNIDWAMRFVQEVESGNLHVNWGTQWRADLMPYGGVKESGMGKEGPKYAIEEMTETKMAVFHLS